LQVGSKELKVSDCGLVVVILPAKCHLLKDMCLGGVAESRWCTVKQTAFVYCTDPFLGTIIVVVIMTVQYIIW